MPHDKNGELLKEGDTVILRCTITKIYEAEDWCNTNIETVEKMFPGDSASTFSVNAKQLELDTEPKDTLPMPPNLPDAA